MRDAALTITPEFERETTPEVLLSYALPTDGPRWLQDMAAVLQPAGVVFARAHSGPDTVRRVELGGLAAAILVADPGGLDGLSLVKIIRSVDGQLPCWLVTEDTTRRTLEAALSLRVTRVITHPIEGHELALALHKLLMGPMLGN